ncbi:MAG: D-alanyl-D-alanine carboxypeptidase [Clostridioides sp.]|nr:D-alanyl-D-alanine carboxypeptidase [Clostridioides sp.]
MKKLTTLFVTVAMIFSQVPFLFALEGENESQTNTVQVQTKDEDKLKKEENKTDTDEQKTKQGDTKTNDSTNADENKSKVEEKSDSDSKDTKSQDFLLDSLTAKSAILIDAGTGKVLLEKNSNDQLPPASVTKVMTMLLICDAIESGKISLDDDVQISENASGMGGSQIFLETGETQKLDTLLKSIAVASANDACAAVAEHIAGSIDGFVKLMNDKAKELKLKNTNFVNTNGLPVENHYTSANDIAVMSKELFEHDMIQKYLNIWMDKVVVGKKKAEIGISNTNKMLKSYNGCIGGKTGFTQEAKYCITVAAKRDNTTLIAVIMGAETSKIRNKEAASLLDYGFANYESVKIASKGANVGSINLQKAQSDKVDLVIKNDLVALVKKGGNKNFKKTIKVNPNIELPIKAGSTLGKIEIKNEKGDLVGEVDLIINKDVNKAGFGKMLEKLIENLV